MSRAVFDLCFFDEIIFDYETLVSTDVTATRLYIEVDRKSLLSAVISRKAGMEIVAGKRVKMVIESGLKTDMLVRTARKASLDIELIGGGN